MQLNMPKSADEAPPKTAIWSCGFRPFFLGGALLSGLLIAAWLLLFFGGLAVGGPMGPIGWHAHEMFFGFVAAVIAGFLLTAVPKWTGTKPLAGPPLSALFALWLAGRIAMVAAGTIPYAAAALIDLLFLPALALAIATPIIRAKTPRNLGFVPLLFGLAAANIVFHLSHLDLLGPPWASLGLDAALAIIVVIIAIVGGRVIPFFTVNRIGYGTRERRRLIDIAAIVLTVAWLFAFLIASTSILTALLALGAGLTNLGRILGWAPLKTTKVPLLWVLHVGYFFVGAGLILQGLSAFSLFAIPSSAAIHALTAGAMGTLCLGMMARVSLGHTGRPLAAPKIMTIAFALIIVAATIRTVIPWLLPQFYQVSITTAGILWSVAWLFFLIHYTPILAKSRVDGRPG